MAKSKKPGGWGVRPYYADLNDTERKAMRLLATLEGVPVGVLVGKAVRALFADDIQRVSASSQYASFFATGGLSDDQKEV